MCYKEIKKTLIDKGMNVSDLAREIGYTRVHTSKIINGHTKSPRAEKLIAFVLGKPQGVLFERNNSLHE